MREAASDVPGGGQDHWRGGLNTPIIYGFCGIPRFLGRRRAVVVLYTNPAPWSGLGSGLTVVSVAGVWFVGFHGSHPYRRGRASF